MFFIARAITGKSSLTLIGQFSDTPTRSIPFRRLGEKPPFSCHQSKEPHQDRVGVAIMSDHSLPTCDSEPPASAGPVLHADDGSQSPLPMPESQSAGAPVDKKLVEETQQQIRLLVNEITDLARQNISISQFYDGFTTRCVTALSSIGGAVWLKQQDQLALEHQVNYAQTQLHQESPETAQHDRLLRRMFETAQPTTIPPSSINHSDDSGNPTPFLLVVAPIVHGGETIGLIEIFQRPGAGPVTQRGYLRFLIQMAELAADFHKARRLRQLDERQTLWSRLDGFLSHVHQSLDVKQTAFNIANEGRRLIECDRLGVAIARGNRLQLAASSGLDMVQRRAEQVQLQEALTTAVCRAKRPLFYNGDTTDLPPQIENCLQDYLDLSHAKSVAIVPLVHQSGQSSEAENGSGSPTSRPRLLGALIVEQLSQQEIPEEQSQRVELVAQHGASALANAQQYHSLFLLPLWQFLGRVRVLTEARNLPKTLTAVIVLALLTMILVAFPYEFAMPAKGVIQPVTRRGIFAMVDGLITDVPLPDQQNVSVEQGQPLISMSNKDLDSEQKILEGELSQLTKMFEDANNRKDQIEDNIDQVKLQGEINEIRMTHASKLELLENLYKKKQLLRVTAPLSGMIDTLNVKQELVGRPVTAGDRLMTIMDPSGPWELELHLPERGAGHVLAADSRNKEALHVEFVLASHPEKTYSGTIKQIDRMAEVDQEHGNSLKVLVAFDHQELNDALRRPGTRVTAKIHCGTRPLGYVMFREVWESVQSQVLFWF